MAFKRILGSRPRSTCKELVMDVIKLVPDASAPLVYGRNASAVSGGAGGAGAGDYTITLRGVGSELLGVTTAVEDAEGMIANWNTYSASAKTIKVLITDDAGTASDAPDSVTIVLWWNTSGKNENV